MSQTQAEKAAYHRFYEQHKQEQRERKRKEYWANHDEILLRQRRYYRKHRKKRLAYRKKYRAEHRLQVNAQHAVEWAIQFGRLERQPCEVCGEKKVDAHHDDYFKPLEVRWFCPKHHKEFHRKE